MHAPDHIVFDIGKVLIHYDPSLPYRHLIPDETERAWFLANVCTPEWNIEQDRGRGWQEAEELLIADHPGHEPLIRAFRQHWHEMVPHHYEESVRVLHEVIDAGHDVTLLTNFASDTYREAEKRFEFLQRPRGVTVSGDAGLIKPDPAIYELHCETFDLKPEACLFIDDSLPNIEAARAFGWQAIHFTAPDKLRGQLAQFGI